MNENIDRQIRKLEKSIEDRERQLSAARDMVDGWVKIVSQKIIDMYPNAAQYAIEQILPDERVQIVIRGEDVIMLKRLLGE